MLGIPFDLILFLLLLSSSCRAIGNQFDSVDGRRAALVGAGIENLSGIVV
jgi:hypothetical protein